MLLWPHFNSNLRNNSNAKEGPKNDFNPFKDFHELETTASILGAWMEFSGMDSFEGKLITEIEC